MIKRLVLTVLILAAAAVWADPVVQKKQMKPALLVIDIQNEYLKMMPDREKEIAMSWMIPAVIQLFRERGFPVIRVYNTDPQYGPKPGTEAFEFPSTVPVKPDDPKIVKNFPSAFKKTDLDKLLREKGCNTLFLCGLSAVGCVLATYHGAMDLDYDAFMIKDALMSHNSSYTDAIEDILDAVGYNAVKVMVDNAQK